MDELLVFCFIRSCLRIYIFSYLHVINVPIDICVDLEVREFILMFTLTLAP